MIDALGGRKNTTALITVALIFILIILNKVLDLGLDPVELFALASPAVAGILGIAYEDAQKAKTGK